MILTPRGGRTGPEAVGKISIQRRKGEVVGYSVYLGVDADGAKRRRFFSDREAAEGFVAEREQSPLPFGELWERRTELLYTLDRIRNAGTTLTEALDFYLAHRGEAVAKTIGQLVEEMLDEKRQTGRSPLYQRTMRFCLGGFVEHVGAATLVSSITRAAVQDYVYRVNGHLQPVSKRALLTNLNVLFNYAKRRDYLDENPVEKIDRPTVPFEKPHVLTPEDFETLLRRCHSKKWHDRLTVFVLVGFCGIRLEEASRLTWSNIDLQRRIVEVPATMAKKAAFRNNVIPPNALEWLRQVEDKRRKGPVIGGKWRTRIRTAIAYAKINYGQNCIRHSFCSYALGAGWPLADVVSYMGHGGSPSVIFSHYRNVVSPEDSKRWWKLVP